MKTEINFEDWMKFDLRVGEVIEINKKIFKINVGENILETKENLNVEMGEKIIVGIQGNKLIFPLVNNSVIVPEKDIENGARIG